MDLVNLILFFVFIVSVSLVVFFSDQIAKVFGKDKLNLIQMYIVSGVVGFLLVVLIALIIASKFQRGDIATNLIVSHFAENIGTEVVFLVFSPVLKWFQR